MSVKARFVWMRIVVSLLASATFLGPVSSVGAQEAAPPPEAPAPEEPKEISTAEFAIEASAVEERLQRIQTQISLIDILDEVRVELEAIKAEGGVLAEKVESALTRRAMSSELNALRFQLQALDAGNDAQVAKLTGYADDLEELSTQNEKDIEVWNRALRKARRPGVPTAVRDRTASILQGLREGRKELQRKLGEVLALQSEALDLRDTIRIAEQKTALALQEQTKSVFERQHPPLWKADAALPEDAAGAASGIRFSWAGVKRYLSDERDTLTLQLVFALLFAWLLLWARKTVDARVEKHEEAGAMPWEEDAVEALRHPLAAALLVGLASVRVLDPHRTIEMVVLVWAIALPLWFIVYKELVPEALRKAVLGLGLLGVLHIVVTMVFGNLRVGRILLLVELGLAFAGALWLIRFLRAVDVPRRVQQGLWFSAMNLWARFALLASLVGFGATVLGCTYLGMEAALVTVVGTIAATAWMALARIVEAVVSTAVHAGQLDAFRMIRTNRDVTARTLSHLTRFAASFLFLWSLGEMTSIWRPVAKAFQGALAADLGFGFAKLGLSLGELLAFFLVLWLSWLVARLVSFVLGEEVFPRLPMKEGVPYAFTTFTRYAIITIGFIAAISAMGVPLDKLTIMLSALGVGIGFGLQKLASTVVSGFILLSERPVRLQDIIQLDSMFGRVSHIGIRATTIRTFDGAELIVPNDDLISARLVNWTLSDLNRRVIMPIGVAYGTDPNEVLTILRRVASENDRVLKSPEPQALFRAFGESSLDFELRFHVESSGIVEVPSELHVAVTEAFAEAGITIPFPQRDLHLRSAAEGVFPPGSVATAAGAEG